VSVVTYWSLQLQSSAPEDVFLFIITLALSSTASTALGLMLGTWARNAHLTVLTSLLCLGIMTILSSFFITDCSLPLGMRIVSYVSIIRWGFKALLMNEFAGVVYSSCDEERYNNQGISSTCMVTSTPSHNFYPKSRARQIHQFYQYLLHYFPLTYRLYVIILRITTLLLVTETHCNAQSACVLATKYWTRISARWRSLHFTCPHFTCPHLFSHNRKERFKVHS
jgi:hypothetical protein